MRLDDIRESDQVEDVRGSGGGVPGGRGGLGVGAVIVLTLIGWATGINPSLLIGGAEVVTNMGGGGRSVSRSAPINDDTKRFVAKILAETEDVWAQVLPEQNNIRYVKAPLVLFSGQYPSGCGTAESAMGPFYCPLDQKVYLDAAFFEEMRTRLGGGGQFAYAYVIAHEIGHHVENLMGILPKVQQAQQRLGKKEGNALSVRVELMADCLAGVWAHHSADRLKIDQADVKQAMDTATAIGDDRLQQQATGRVVPDSFTHGSSQQRVTWFMTGLKTGQTAACDTFRRRDS